MSVHVSVAGAQWTSVFDAGGGVRRGIGAPVSPMHFGASAQRDLGFGRLTAGGNAVLSSGALAESGVATQFRSRPLFGMSLTGSFATNDALYRQRERYARSDLTIGAATSFIGIEATVEAGRAWLHEVVTTEPASVATLHLSADVARIRLGVLARGLGYASYVSQVAEKTYMIAGYPFTSTVDELVPVRVQRTDIEASVSVPLGPIQVSSRFGLRRSLRGLEHLSPQHYANTEVALPVLRSMSLVIGGGNRLAAPELRLPAYRFVTAGIRLTQRASHTRGEGPNGVRSDVATIELTPADGGGRILRMHGIVARNVEVMGDFTDWQPMALVSAGRGSWRLAVPLSAGVHRLMVRTNGGAWFAPPSLPVAHDEYDQAVGILLVGN